MSSFDYILVGGGLQNALLLLALIRRNPAARVALIERSPELAGNHTWCFHAADLPSGAEPVVKPLVIQRWPGYAVHFPGSNRELAEPYAALSSSRVREEIKSLTARHPNVRVLLNAEAKSLEPFRVELTSGEVLSAEVVIDARGPERLTSGIRAYQKFVGVEFEVDPRAAPSLPTLMDARVPQLDGFRFFYVLPLAPDRVLIEDTYFSDTPTLETARIRERIAEYARSLGISVKTLVREESGVLPLPMRAIEPGPVRSGLIVAGYQGGWFHPTTGYSFPLAIRFALTVASCPITELVASVSELARDMRQQQRFCILLNRLLFDAFAPEQRFHVLERFYRLPTETVRRFYALSLCRADRARILCGRPPQGFSTLRLLSSFRTLRPTPSNAGEHA